MSETSAATCDIDKIVASPCIGVCKLDRDSNLCVGCLRSGDEIAVWGDADHRLRQEILERIDLRRTIGCASPPSRRPADR